jgi:hypothetical protein
MDVTIHAHCAETDRIRRRYLKRYCGSARTVGKRTARTGEEPRQVRHLSLATALMGVGRFELGETRVIDRRALPGSCACRTLLRGDGLPCHGRSAGSRAPHCANAIPKERYPPAADGAPGELQLLRESAAASRAQADGGRRKSELRS